MKTINVGVTNWCEQIFGKSNNNFKSFSSSLNFIYHSINLRHMRGVLDFPIRAYSWVLSVIAYFFVRLEFKVPKLVQYLQFSKSKKLLQDTTDSMNIFVCGLCIPFFTVSTFLIDNIFFQEWLINTKSKNVLYFVDPISILELPLKNNHKLFDGSNYTNKLLDNFDVIASYSQQDCDDYNLKFVNCGINLNYYDILSNFAKRTSHYIPGKFDLVYITSIIRPSKAFAYLGLTEFAKKNKRIALIGSPPLKLSYVFLRQFDMTQLEIFETPFNVSQLTNCEIGFSDELNCPGGNFVNRVLNTNCVCVITGAPYLTIAHFEAVLFNKRLMTDSNLALSQPWYNPNLVRIIDPLNISQDDIDWAALPIPKDEAYPNLNSISTTFTIEKLWELATEV